MPSNQKEITKQFMWAMSVLKEPEGSTLRDMVTVLGSPDVTDKQLKKELIQAISKGINYGFIKKRGRRYRLGIDTGLLHNLLRNPIRRNTRGKSQRNAFATKLRRSRKPRAKNTNKKANKRRRGSKSRALRRKR